MPMVDEEFLRQLLQACADRAPEPLYPARHAAETKIERAKLDAGFDELRGRGLVQFTEWVKDAGQGYAPTELGRQSLAANRLPKGPVAAAPTSDARSAINPYERGEIVRAALLSPGRAYLCWILLIANVLFFLDGAIYVWREDLSLIDYLRGDCLRGKVPVLYELGALWPPSTVWEGPLRRVFRPQLERMVLCLFLHAGSLHLLMNIGFLATLAREIEAMWGWVRFLVIYVVAGIVSSCVVILISRLDNFRTDQVPITVGASGPLYGLFTAMVVWFSLNYEHLPDNLVQEWSRTIGFSLFLLMSTNFVPYVSWEGHFGGAVGGLLAGLLLHAQRFHPSALVRFLAIAAVPVIPAGFFLAVLWQAGYF